MNEVCYNGSALYYGLKKLSNKRHGCVSDNNIPCQSCYQKLTQVENNWAKSEQEREAAMSRAELWKELYTKEVERTASTDETEEDIGDDETEVKPEPVSLQSCWNFVMKNFTAGNHLFQVDSFSHNRSGYLLLLHM